MPRQANEQQGRDKQTPSEGQTKYNCKLGDSARGRRDVNGVEIEDEVEEEVLRSNPTFGTECGSSG